MTLVEVKEECEKVLKTVEKLYAERATNLINKDLTEYIANHPGRIVKEDIKYILDEKIQIRIVDGNVDIIDDRGSAFGWLFEIDSDIYRGDAVVINGKVEKVEFVRSMRDEAMLDTAMEVVERLEKSIQTLNSTGIENYSYYSAHEDIKVNDFEAMINIILNRKPTIF